MTINAIDQLREDHQNLISIMDELESAIDNETGNYQGLFQEFKKTFNMHDKAEDEIVYPILWVKKLRNLDSSPAIVFS